MWMPSFLIVLYLQLLYPPQWQSSNITETGSSLPIPQPSLYPQFTVLLVFQWDCLIPCFASLYTSIGGKSLYHLSLPSLPWVFKIGAFPLTYKVELGGWRGNSKACGIAMETHICHPPVLAWISSVQPLPSPFLSSVLQLSPQIFMSVLPLLFFVPAFWLFSVPCSFNRNSFILLQLSRDLCFPTVNFSQTAWSGIEMASSPFKWQWRCHSVS